MNGEEDEDFEIAVNNVQVAFGEPGNDAEEIASIVDENNQITIFEYEQGSELQNEQEADEARIGLFVQEQDIADLNGDGEDILEAAILYTITGRAE